MPPARPLSTPSLAILLSFGPFRLDPDAGTLLYDGELVGIQPLALELLSLLVQQAGSCVSSAALSEALWPSTVVSPHSLEQLVYRVRTALGEHREQLVTLPGRGYGFFGRVRRIPRPGQYALPPVPPPLLGREADLAALQGLLAQHALVSVLGPMGLGKSSLLRALAHALPGACWVELDGVQSTSEVAGRVLAALGLPPSEDPVRQILQGLQTVGGLTLVLDTCEAWADRVALGAWLEALPEVRAVAGSRVAISVACEQQYPLPPLPRSAAEALLQQRLPALAPSHAARLLERAGGNPLAIELLTAHLRDQAEDGVQAYLQGAAPEDPLLRSVEEALRALPEPMVAALEQLSVFPAAFRFPDAAAVLALPALEVLETLLDHNLIRADGSGALALFPFIRETVHQRTPPERRHAQRARHAAHMLARMREGDLTTDDLSSLIVAGRFEVEAGRTLQILPALRAAAERLGVLIVLEPVVEHALSGGHVPDDDARAVVLRYRALVQMLQGQHSAALESLALARRLAPEADETERLWVEVFVLSSSRQMDRAADCLRRLCVRLEAEGSPAVAKARRDLGDLLSERGRLREAMVWTQAALEGALAHGDEAEIGRCQGGIGILLARQGDFAGAAVRLQAAADATAAQPMMRAYWLGWQGYALRALGDAPQAMALYIQGRDLFEASGTSYGRCIYAAEIGRTLLVLGDLDGAAAALDGAIQASQQDRRALSEGFARAYRAVVAGRRGEAGAWDAMQQAVARIESLLAETVALEALLSWIEAPLPCRAEALAAAQALVERASLSAELWLVQRLQILASAP